jgi:hypothetical protein
MSETRFTPGPWTAVKGEQNDANATGVWGDVMSNCYALASVWSDAEDIEAQAEANARLMAAAPDYHNHAYHLAMLVLQSDLYGADREVRAQVDHVLAIHAKAEGRA